MLSRLNMVGVCEARFGKEWAQALADADAEIMDEAKGFAELAIIVGEIVCVPETKPELDAMTDPSEDDVSVELETNGALFVRLEITVVFEGEAVAKGGMFRSGVAVGQSLLHSLISFAPCT